MTSKQVLKSYGKLFNPQNEVVEKWQERHLVLEKSWETNSLQTRRGKKAGEFMSWRHAWCWKNVNPFWRV